MQTFLGGKMAHDYADRARFYGIDLNSHYLPFQIARAWHLQLAIFWIATAWLGMGIFIAPLVSGREPKGQRALVNILFGALVVVVVGSLTGEYLAMEGDARAKRGGGSERRAGNTSSSAACGCTS